MHVIVTGAGVMGLLTADALARRGAHVTVLEQDHVPSRAATSYDEHRIIRAFHAGEPRKTSSAARAERAWLALQRRLGGAWYHRVGAVTALSAPAAARGAALLREAGVQHQRLTSGALASRYPAVRWPQGHSALFEPHAGILLADHVLHTLTATLARHPNVQLCAQHRVRDVHAARSAVTLADGRELRAERLVLTMGAWSQPFTKRPGRAYRQVLAYAKPPAPRVAAWATLPAIPAVGDASGAWLIPPVAGTHLKLANAAACRLVQDPHAPLPEAPMLDALLRTFTGLLPDFDPSWVTHTRTCAYLAHPHYTHPHVVTLDGQGRTIALAACGGSAFKFAPLIATSIARRLLGHGVHAESSS